MAIPRSPWASWNPASKNIRNTWYLWLTSEMINPDGQVEWIERWQVSKAPKRVSPCDMNAVCKELCTHAGVWMGLYHILRPWKEEEAPQCCLPLCIHCFLAALIGTASLTHTLIHSILPYLRPHTMMSPSNRLKPQKPCNEMNPPSFIKLFFPCGGKVTNTPTVPVSVNMSM